MPRLQFSRSQILAFRRRVGSLDERLPHGPQALRRAAWAGLQDSMPRAALLSIHARVEGAQPDSWEHPSLVQIWGPRYSAYAVAARDLAPFTLGRLPEAARPRARAHDAAARLHAFLNGRRMPFGNAGHGLGVPHNSLRYATATGTVVLRWDGARQPVVWTVPAPDVDPCKARAELARRFLHVFGPSTSAAFAKWAGIAAKEAHAVFQALAKEFTPVRTPLGDACILTTDVDAMRAKPMPPAPVRLLPSGDTYYLFWGADRELLVPDPKHRAALWTSRVWPGALLVEGEIAGVWRRTAAALTIEPWRRLTPSESEAIEREAASLPLPGPATVEWK